MRWISFYFMNSNRQEPIFKQGNAFPWILPREWFWPRVANPLLSNMVGAGSASKPMLGMLG
jgi:hypothetical protein